MWLPLYRTKPARPRERMIIAAAVGTTRDTCIMYTCACVCGPWACRSRVMIYSRENSACVILFAWSADPRADRYPARGSPLILQVRTRRRPSHPLRWPWLAVRIGHSGGQRSLLRIELYRRYFPSTFNYYVIACIALSPMIRYDTRLIFDRSILLKWWLNNVKKFGTTRAI